jgi:hypothetical protein
LSFSLGKMDPRREAINTQASIHAVLLLLVGSGGTLFAAEPFAGTWRLDPLKSSGTIPKGETVIIQEHGRTLSVEVQVVNGSSDNSTFLIRYTVPKNGGAGQVQKGPYDGVTVRRISANAIETTYLSGGKEARSTRAVISKDGRTMSSTGQTQGSQEYVAWTMVFEKQEHRTH